MACTRGCVGTPICSALDICCIQFRADCGSGCGGLADGYSRIQVDDTGALIVCSNVGGVCTCEEPAGACCSTLTPNLDGTWTHDDGIGNTTTLDVCELLRESNCTLQLEDELWILIGNVGAPIPPATPWTVFQGPDCVAITNTSDEDMYVNLHVSATQFEAQNLAATVENMEVQREISTDGGGTWLTMGGACGHNGIDIYPQGGPGEYNTITFCDYQETLVLAPGATGTYCVRASYQSAGGITNATMNLDHTRITVHGIAIPFV